MSAAPHAGVPAGTLECSVVIPCLNEAETVAGCVSVARRALDAHRIAGEVIVADNGSTDGSPRVASDAGARVVHVEGRGYGSALMGGIAAARSPYVVMGDADQSYDFAAIPDVHTLLFASLALICGYQSALFAFMTKIFAIREALLPPDPRLNRLYRVLTLERGLQAGFGTIGIGLVLLLVAINQWRLQNFGDLNYAETMRWVIPGMTLTVLGFQTILSSFYFSILGMHRR